MSIFLWQLFGNVITLMVNATVHRINYDRETSNRVWVRGFVMLLMHRGGGGGGGMGALSSSALILSLRVSLILRGLPLWLRFPGDSHQLNCKKKTGSVWAVCHETCASSGAFSWDVTCGHVTRCDQWCHTEDRFHCPKLDCEADLLVFFCVGGGGGGGLAYDSKVVCSYSLHLQCKTWWPEVHKAKAVGRKKNLVTLVHVVTQVNLTFCMGWLSSWLLLSSGWSWWLRPELSIKDKTCRDDIDKSYPWTTRLVEMT